MKLLIITFACIIAVSSLSEKDHWLAFKQKHGRVYKNIAEENYRFSVFQSNLREINEHNERYERGESSYYLGINKFTDKTSEEFRSMLQRQKRDLSNVQESYPVQQNVKDDDDDDDDPPAAIDWRQLGAVLPVRDQGECGTSWAFAVIGSYEGQNAIINNKTIPLSPQQLINCFIDFGEECNPSGSTYAAISLGSVYGIVSESEYPYVGNQQVCRVNESNAIVFTNGMRLARYTEDNLASIVGLYGPVANNINADCIQHYGGGIFSNSTCPNTQYDLNFAVLTVGYNTTDDGTDYWIIKNSWGTGWGEDGYIRVKRGNLELGINLSGDQPMIDQI